jgi:hypothetical protein
MTTIHYDLTVDDLIHFNQLVAYKRLLMFMLVFWFVLEMTFLVQYISNNDLKAFLTSTGTEIIALGGLSLSLFYPRRMAIVGAFIIVFIAVALFLSTADPVPAKISSFLTLLPVMLIAGFGGLGINIFLAYFYQGKNGMTGLHELTVDPTGLLEKTDINETKHTWAAISRIDQTKDYILLFIGSPKAHLIPKRSFKTPNDAIQFFSEVSELKRQSST